MSFIHQAKINDVNYDIIGSCYYGTSSTAAGTAAKVATISNADGFVLVPGVQVVIKFTTANSASSPTLNVNSTGAISIRYRGAAITSSAYYWAANQVVSFVYDGTYWHTTDYLKNPNSDTKVTQNATGVDAEYPLLLKYDANSTNVTNTVKYASTITANPSSTRITLNDDGVAMIDSLGITASDSNSIVKATLNELSLTNLSTGSCVQFIKYNDEYIGYENNLEKNISNTNYNYGESAINYGSSEIKYDGSLLKLGSTYDDSSSSLGGNVIRLGSYNVIESPDQAPIAVVSQIPFDLQSNSGFALLSSTQDSGESGLFFNAGGINTLDGNKKIDFDNGTITGFQIEGGAVPQKITLVATAGQTAFTIPFEYDSLSSNLTVYFNGILMKETDNYTVNTSNNTVNLAGFSAEAGDVVTIMGLLGAQSIDFGQEAIDAINQINAAVAAAKEEIDLKLEEIEDFINELPDDTTKLMAKNTNNTMESGYKITMASNYTPSGNYDVATKLYVDNKTSGMATQTYVNNQISTATASIVTDVFATGSTSPDNGYSGTEATKRRKLLWIDTGASDPGLKYYNGSSWVTVPVRWS